MTAGRGFEAAPGRDGFGGVPLVPGWNLASLPRPSADSAPAAVLQPIAGAYHEVWTYDACNAGDPWKLYDPADPGASDLTALDHKVGFWIDAATAATLPAEGELPATTTIPLCPGWNLITPTIPTAISRPRPTRWATSRATNTTVTATSGR